MGYLLELLVSYVLRKRLKKFLGNVSSANLGIQLQKGVLHLQDFALDPEACAALDLPLTVKTARINKLEVLLPWRQSPPAPLVVRVHGVRLVATTLNPPADAEELQACLQQLKLSKLKQLLEEPIAANENDGSSQSSALPFNVSQLQSLVDALLRDLQVSVTDLVLRFEEGAGLPAVQLALQSLQLRCQREQTLPRLLSFCFGRRDSQGDEHSARWHVEAACGVSWLPVGAEGGSRGGVEATSSEEVEVLRRLTLRGEVGMRMQWPGSILDAATAGWSSSSGRPPQLRLDGSLELGCVSVEVGDAQLRWAVHVARRMAFSSHFWRYSALCSRPHVAARASAWWQYALAAVQLDLREARAEVSWRTRRERRDAERAYETVMRRRLLEPVDPELSPEDDAEVGPLVAALDLPTLLAVHARIGGDTPRASGGRQAGAPAAAKTRPFELEFRLRTSFTGAEIALHTCAGAATLTGSSPSADAAFRRCPASTCRAPPGRRSTFHTLLLDLGPVHADFSVSRVNCGGRPTRLAADCSAAVSWLQLSHRHHASIYRPEPWTLCVVSSPALPGKRRSSASSRRPIAQPQWQLSCNFDSGGVADEEQRPQRAGIALASGTPLTICIDWATVAQLTLLARRLAVQAPARFATADAHRPRSADCTIAAVGTDAPLAMQRPLISVQVDLSAPTLIVACALDQPVLSTPLLQLSRVHAQLSPQAELPEGGLATGLTLWAHVGIGLSLARQHSLEAVLGDNLSPRRRDSSSQARRISSLSSVGSSPPLCSPSGSLESTGPHGRYNSIDATPHANLVLRSSSRANSLVGYTYADSEHDGIGSPPDTPYVAIVLDGFGDTAHDSPTLPRTLGHSLERLGTGAVRTIERAVRRISSDESSSSFRSLLTGVVPSHDALLGTSSEVLALYDIPVSLELPEDDAPGSPALRLRVEGALPAVHMHFWTGAAEDTLALLDFLQHSIRSLSSTGDSARPSSEPPSVRPSHSYDGSDIVEVPVVLLSQPPPPPHPPPQHSVPVARPPPPPSTPRHRAAAPPATAPPPPTAPVPISLPAPPPPPPARADLTATTSAPRSSPPPTQRKDRLDLRLQLPLVALHIHSVAPPCRGGAADILTLRAEGIELRFAGSAGSADVAIYGRELALVDSRPGVRGERSSALLLRGQAPPPLGLGVALGLGRAAQATRTDARRSEADREPTPGEPLLSGFYAPAADRVLGVQLRVSAPSLQFQWNPGLAVALVHFGLELADVVGGASKAPGAAASAPAPAPPAAASSRLRFKLEAQVEEIELCLNVDEQLPAAPIELLLRLRAACRKMSLQLDEAGNLALRLEAALHEIRCPLTSPPATGTFRMVAPLRGETAAAVVAIRKDSSTLGLLEVLVDAEPVIFEFRNQAPPPPPPPASPPLATWPCQLATASSTTAANVATGAAAVDRLHRAVHPQGLPPPQGATSCGGRQAGQAAALVRAGSSCGDGDAHGGRGRARGPRRRGCHRKLGASRAVRPLRARALSATSSPVASPYRPPGARPSSASPHR